MILATLPDRFFAVLFVECLVPDSDTTGCCIDDDVSFLNHLLNTSSNRNSRIFKGLFFGDVCYVKRISPFLCNERFCTGFCFGDTNDLHVGLCGDCIGHTFSDGSIAVDCDLDHNTVCFLFGIIKAYPVIHSRATDRFSSSWKNP